MDWDNSYYTMSESNNYAIWAFLKKLFDEDKIYPRDKEHVEGKKTLSEVDGSQGSKLFMRNKNVKVKKSLHWKPFLEYYCNHEYWNIEYKKFLKTLPYYEKVFSSNCGRMFYWINLRNSPCNWWNA